MIDYFLGQNRTLQDIGKILICWVIMACEEKYLERHANPNRSEALERSAFQQDRDTVTGLDITKFKDDWYRFILHKLVTSCRITSDLRRNNVSFITFNYDVSLEHALYHGLTAIDIFEPDDVSQFLDNQRIIHCYGRVRGSVDPPKVATSFKSFFDPIPRPSPTDALVQRRFDNDRLGFLDEVFEASKRLSTIDPLDKTSNANLMLVAQDEIKKADVVYILGYGFDENNTDRIGLASGLARPNPKNVMFTNFGDINRVNKKAGRAMLGNFSVFLPSRPPLQPFNPTGYVEKSTRNVYDALELDFDELEDG